MMVKNALFSKTDRLITLAGDAPLRYSAPAYASLHTEHSCKKLPEV